MVLIAGRFKGLRATISDHCQVLRHTPDGRYIQDKDRKGCSACQGYDDVARLEISVRRGVATIETRSDASP